MGIKYIRLKIVGFILWPRVYPDPDADPISHKNMSVFVKQKAGNDEILSAGFVQFKNGKAFCSGNSQSLGLGSLEEDSGLLSQQLGMSS